MSDLQISTTLATLSSTLQSLSSSLEDEKNKHIQLLKNISDFLTNSSETTLGELNSFLEAINTHELVEIVAKSKTICEQQQEKINLLGTKIVELSNQLDESILQLDEQSKLVLANVESNVQSIQSQIVNLVSDDLKKKILENFNSLFLEENEKISLSIKTINQKTVNSIIDVYNDLLSKSKEIKNRHVSALDSFEENVTKFNLQLVQSVENIEQSFSDVKKITQKNMSKLYQSCFNFQDEVIKKINIEMEKLDEYFNEKVTKTIELVEHNFDKTYQKFQELDQKLVQKHGETAKILETNSEVSLGLTQKIIEKQEILFKDLSNKLKFKYFSINSISILVITLTILVGLNISATVRHNSLANYNMALSNEISTLKKEISEAKQIRHDSVELTKKSILDVKKKFPKLVVQINCKELK